MDRNSMVTRIGTFADAIKKLDRKEVFETPSSVLESNTLSFLYEMVCYFYLISNLRGVIELRYRKATKGHVFAHPTGNKPNFAYFYVRFVNGKYYDICLNTGISDVYRRERYPDISLQVHNEAEVPTHERIVAIWDAKHRSKNDKDEIVGGEFEKFVRDMAVLKVQRPEAGDLLELSCPEAFNVCALITNGEMPGEPIERMLDLGFSCTTHFVGVPGQLPSPTRQQQQEHGASMQSSLTPAAPSSLSISTTSAASAALFSAENAGSPPSATKEACP